MLRVALDCGPLLDPPTGVGRYVRELATSLAPHCEVVRYAVAYGGGRDDSITRWRLPARAARWSWRRLGRPHLERLVGAVDLVHATNFVLPALRSTPGVVTVHDLSFLRDDTWPGGERLRDLVPWSLRRAASVIVPSNAVRLEVGERYGLEDGRVVVTPEGVAPAFFGATPLGAEALGRLGIPGRFIVAVGTIEPRKNLARLLRAWRGARSELPGVSLVLAGPKGWGPELEATEGVVLTGWVGDATLPGLLAAAEAFCYPSLYEGFGLPPLEAMATGTPALVGSYDAAPEVLGDAALLIDPLDTDALTDGLVRIASDDPLRRKLASAGRARASTYTWERTARLTAAAYRRVC